MIPKPPADTSWVQTTSPARSRTLNAVRAYRWGWAALAASAAWVAVGAVFYLWWTNGSVGREIYDVLIRPNLLAAAVLAIARWRYWAGRRDQEQAGP